MSCSTSPKRTLRRSAIGVLVDGVVGAIPVGAESVVRQQVVVEVESAGATFASLRLIEVAGGEESVLVGPVVARVGRNGVKGNRREGDGTTPIGSFGIDGAFGVPTSPRVALPYRRVRNSDCWISDVADRFYNRLTARRRCVSPNEDLSRIASAGPYEYALTTDYNTSPIVVGKGSAIFIHVHAYDRAGRTKPTSGCVSVSRAAMKRLFALLDPAKSPILVVRVKE